MAGRLGQNAALGVSFVLWLVVMGVVVHVHYIRKVDPELEYFAPDILVEGGGRDYYSLMKDGRKVGYKWVSVIRNPQSLICMENSVVKLNLAGMSREVFIQCAASIDTTRILSRHLSFNIQSGSYSYDCRALVSGDSLIVEVTNSDYDFWRKGVFMTSGNLTYPAVLPYYIHHSTRDTLDISVFDPVVFGVYDVHVVRAGEERLELNDRRMDVVRYDLELPRGDAVVWIDEAGRPVRSTGPVFFAGELGDMTIELDNDRNVLMLPLEVTLGNDMIKRTRIVPDKPVPNPRETRYLEVRLDGIRAANIDVAASNKRLISANPVVFGIENVPIMSRNRRLDAMMFDAARDTAIVGTSDYIQSRDARIRRTAERIVASETDTLLMARKINRWVFENMRRVPGMDITRSIDVFRDRKGDSDEYTKLFTALSRSVGIPTQINNGLVYEGDAFVYHSWPSVFADGVWHDLDPMFGQDRADATHISLVRGGYDRLVELLRVLGRLKISILDVR